MLNSIRHGHRRWVLVSNVEFDDEDGDVVVREVLERVSEEDL